MSKAGGVYSWSLPQGSAVLISANKPILVAQYASSGTTSGEHTDPAMSIITPDEMVSYILVLLTLMIQLTL